MTAAAARAMTWTPRRLFHGVVATYMNVAVGALLGFLLTPVLLDALGDRRYGTWVMVLSILSYIGFLEAGVGTAATTRASAVNATGGEREVARVLGTVRALMIAVSAVTITISAAVAWWLPGHLGDTGVSPGALRLTVLLAAGWQSLLFLSQVWNALYAGTGRLATALRVGLVFNVVINVAQVFGVLAGWGLVAMGAALAGGTLVQLLVFVSMARRHYPGLRVTVREASFEQARTLLRLGARNLGVTLAWTLSAGLDILIVGLVVGPIGAAAYGVASKGASLARVITARFADAFVPAYGEAWHSGRLERLSSLYRLTLLFGLVCAIPLAFCLVAVSGPLLRVWLSSPPPAGSTTVLIILGALVALQIPGLSAVTLLIATEQTHKGMRLLLVAAAVNGVLSVWLTFAFGVTGPAVATLIVTLVFDPVLFVLVIRNRLGLGLRPLLLPVVAYITPATLAAGLVAVAAALVPYGDLVKVLVAVAVPVTFVAVLFAHPGTKELPPLRALLAAVRRGAPTGEAVAVPVDAEGRTA